MATSLFITGGSGFIGTAFLNKLDPKDFRKVVCLGRHKPQGEFSWIEGGLRDAARYEAELAACDTVLHLAAATGKATREECFEVNGAATEFFVKQCERAGVKRFLNVSTIAVKFRDATRYYYAQSKLAGEEAVKKSRLSYAIVRPTIVLGKGSNAWKGLSSLAFAPVVPLFDGGRAAIQPILVDDVADALLTVLRDGLFRNETYELGGSETVTVANFLKRAHRARFGKDPKTLSIPTGPIIPVLGMLEAFLYSILPMNSGQFSPFRNDGTAQPNELSARQLATTRNVDQILKAVLADA